MLPDWLIEEDLLSGRLVRVLPQWKAKDLPLHVVCAGQRLLPARVSAFIDFGVRYMEDELRRLSSNKPPFPWSWTLALVRRVTRPSPSKRVPMRCSSIPRSALRAIPSVWQGRSKTAVEGAQEAFEAGLAS